MNTKGSYLFENLEGREREAELLEERAQLRLDGFVSLLQRHGFSDHSRILEAGTAQGIRARLIAQTFPDSEVIGIDRSPELLEKARERHKDQSNLTFVEADLYELPFADASFDFVYARLVFMHLAEPLRAIESLKRVLKPGGRILIEDADRDCMFFEPAPASLAPFWRKVQEGQRRLGGDPNVGRKLAPYLKTAGFADVRLEVQTLLGGGAEIEFLARTLLPSLNIYQEPAEREAGLAAIDELRRLAHHPAATFYHFWFVVSGGQA